jgi:hypothetical protein
MNQHASKRASAVRGRRCEGIETLLPQSSGFFGEGDQPKGRNSELYTKVCAVRAARHSSVTTHWTSSPAISGDASTMFIRLMAPQVLHNSGLAWGSGPGETPSTPVWISSSRDSKIAALYVYLELAAHIMCEAE